MPTSNSAYDLRQGLHGRDSYQDQNAYNNGAANGGGYYGGPNGGPNGNGARQRYSRIASEPMIHGHLGRPDPNGNNIYPIPNNHRSYETVASGAGSSGTSGEPAGYQTDPTSSDNSSIERRQSPSKPHMMGPQGQAHQNMMGPYGGGANPPGVNTYGYNGNGYNGNGYSNNNIGAGPKRNSPPIQLSSAPMQQPQQLQQQQPQMGGMSEMQNGGSMPPSMSPSKNVITRKATNLSSQASVQTLTAPAADKRKSWFSKRFSRQH